MEKQIPSIAFRSVYLSSKAAKIASESAIPDPGKPLKGLPMTGQPGLVLLIEHNLGILVAGMSTPHLRMAAGEAMVAHPGTVEAIAEKSKKGKGERWRHYGNHNLATSERSGDRPHGNSHNSSANLHDARCEIVN